MFQFPAVREFLGVSTATPTERLGWRADGTVTDAKTLTGTLWLKNVLSGTWTLDSQGPGDALRKAWRCV